MLMMSPFRGRGRGRSISWDAESLIWSVYEVAQSSGRRSAGCEERVPVEQEHAAGQLHDSGASSPPAPGSRCGGRWLSGQQRNRVENRPLDVTGLMELLGIRCGGRYLPYALVAREGRPDGARSRRTSVRLLLGRCGACGRPPPPAPGVPELLSGAAFAAMAATGATGFTAAAHYWLAACGVALVLIDVAVKRPPPTS